MGTTYVVFDHLIKIALITKKPGDTYHVTNASP
jgi:hypothetical protein